MVTTTWALVVAGAAPPAATPRRQSSTRASARRRSAGRGSAPPLAAQGLGADRGSRAAEDGGAFGVELAADPGHPVLQRAQPQALQPPSAACCLPGRVVAQHGHQLAADGDHVAVVAGLGHLGQPGQGLLTGARGQGVLDLAQLAQRGDPLAHGDRAA